MLQYIASSSVLMYIPSLSDFLWPIAMLIFPKFLFLRLDRSTGNSCITDNDELGSRLISTNSREVLFRTNTIATCTDYDGFIDRWQNKLKTVLFPSRIRGAEKSF